jgi:sensor histidine kinase YesM
MKNSKPIRPLQKKLIFFTLLSLFISFSISTLIAYGFIISGNLRSYSTNGQKQANLISKQIEDAVQAAEQIALGLVYNRTIQNLFRDESLLNSLEEHNIIRYVLSDYRNFTDPGNITLFSVEGKPITSSDGYDMQASIKSLPFFSSLQASYGEPVWVGVHKDANDYANRNESVISLMQKVRRLDIADNSKTGTLLGYILININIKYFRDILVNAQWSDEGSLSLYMDDSTLACEIGSNPKGRNLLHMSAPIGRYSWTLIGKLPISRAFKDAAWLFWVILVEILVALIFIAYAARLSKKIASPLKELEKQMARENLNPSSHTFIESNIEEINSIQDSYHKTTDRLVQLAQKLKETELMEKDLEVATIQAQLSALQHQINPHFLYNTLDSIHWLAEAENNENITAMVEKLSDFLRFTARTSGRISIEQEIENIDNYVYIQKIRYGERFNYRKEIEGGLYGISILPMIIQPLIENAIIHAEREDMMPVNIVLSISEKEDVLCIVVKDDGIGMREDALETLLENIRTEKVLGLSNVFKRIRLAYGETSSYSISSKENKGTTITIVLPL